MATGKGLGGIAMATAGALAFFAIPGAQMVAIAAFAAPLVLTLGSAITSAISARLAARKAAQPDAPPQPPPSAPAPTPTGAPPTGPPQS